MCVVFRDEVVCRPRKARERVHRLQIFVMRIVAVNHILRHGQFAQHVAQAAAVGDNGFCARSQKMRFNRAVISEEAKRSALVKAKLFSIDLDNFVLFVPNATSQDLLPIEFWQGLTRELNAKGAPDGFLSHFLPFRKHKSPRSSIV